MMVFVNKVLFKKPGVTDTITKFDLGIILFT